jgi:translation initiation factor 3 subunit F
VEVIAAAAHPDCDNIMDLPPQAGPGRVKDRLSKLQEVVDHCIDFVSSTIDLLKKKSPMTGEDAANLNRLGHVIARIVAARTDLNDVCRMETEIRDLKTILDLASQARKQVMVTELVMYGAACKYD